MKFVPYKTPASQLLTFMYFETPEMLLQRLYKASGGGYQDRSSKRVGKGGKGANLPFKLKIKTYIQQCKRLGVVMNISKFCRDNGGRDRKHVRKLVKEIEPEVELEMMEQYYLKKVNG